MKLEIKSIKEIKVVEIKDASSTFCYIDKTPKGWRLVYTSDLDGDLEIIERK